MRKHHLSGLRPLLFALMASTLILPCTGCNSDLDNPEPSSNNNITQVTDVAGKENTSPTVENSEVKDDTPKEESTTSVPQFSAEGGFYEKPFLLSLTCEPGETIYYTMDGSDPRTSATASLYEKNIQIYNNTAEDNVYSALTDISLSGYQPPKDPVDKGMVVRAVIKTADGDYGSVVTNSYFVGKTASYYSDFKVISMVTDSDYLFHHNTGAYMIGSKYFDWLNSDEYEPLDAGDVKNVTNYNTKGRETEFPVAIQVFEKGNAVYSTDVGARISGNWSRAHAQKSFRLYARKEYGNGKMDYTFFDELTDVNGTPIEKFDKVTLRNGGNDYQELHFRDALIHDLTKDLAFDVMASEPCILFIDGEFWGFYMIREKTDGEYIESHYGIDKNDVAIIKNSDIEEGTEEDLEEFREFCIWATSADMTQEENYNTLCNSMDIQSLMDYVTVETYINNNDWANGVSNNWQAWHTRTVNPELPKADGKWRFILYDTEFSTGLYGSEQTQLDYDLLNRMSVGDEDFDIPGILRNLCNNETFRQAFYENYLHIMETCFAPDSVGTKIDAYATAYGEATKATWFRFGLDWAAWNYEGEVNQFKEYFSRRPFFAKRFLNSFCGIESDEESPSGNLIPPTSGWTYYGSATYTAFPEENAFRVTVQKKTRNVWDIQSQACDILLEKGCTYKLSFEASCTTPCEFDVGFNRFDGWGYPTSWWQKLTLGTEPETYEFFFTMEHNTDFDWRLCFNFGHGEGDFVIKNVSLEKIEG